MLPVRKIRVTIKQGIEDALSIPVIPMNSGETFQMGILSHIILLADLSLSVDNQ